VRGRGRDEGRGGVCGGGVGVAFAVVGVFV